VEPRLLRAANEALVIVARGIDQVSDDLFRRPLARGARLSRLRFGNGGEIRFGRDDDVLELSSDVAKGLTGHKGLKECVAHLALQFYSVRLAAPMK
jgi:hypothetical protein